MYGLGQFHHRQNKGEERRGEIWQKKQQLLSKHRAAVDGKNSQKTEEREAFDEHHPHLMKDTQNSFRYTEKRNFISLLPRSLQHSNANEELR